MEFPLIGKFKRPLPWLLGVMAAGTLVVGTGTYFVSQANKPKIDLNKLTVPAQAQTITVRIDASGKVIPIESVNLSPKTTGRLAKLFVEQGDRVQQGQQVALMENADLQAQLAKAQADLKQAEARLAESKAGSRIEEINQAQARLAQAQANLDAARAKNPTEIDQVRAQIKAAQARVALAQTRASRYRNLAAQGAISQDRMDEVLTEERNALAALNEAEQRLNQQQNTDPPEIAQLVAAVAQARIAWQQLQNGNRPEQIAQLTAAVEAAQAQVQAIQIQLDDTVIRAPFSGIVTQKYASVGAFVTPTTSASSTDSATSTSIVAIAKGLEVRAIVPEVNIGQIQTGQMVEIIADAFPDKVFKGRVRLVAPEAVQEQNVVSFQVRVTLLTGEKELQSGMSVNLKFLGEKVNNALMVPTAAIATQDGATGVWVPDSEHKPQFKPVTIGSTVEQQTQVLEGLKPNERVFIELPEGYQPKDQKAQE